MNIESIKKELIGLVSTLFADNGFDVDMIEYADLVDDLGMDSLTFISLIVEIESTFDITIPDDSLIMDNYRSIERVQKIIEHQLLSEEQKCDEKTK